MKIKFNFIRKTIDRIKRFYGIANNNVLKSIRLQLIITFAMCILAAFIITGMASSVFTERYADISYSSSVNEIDMTARQIAEEINALNERADEYQESPPIESNVYPGEVNKNTYPSENQSSQNNVKNYSNELNDILDINRYGNNYKLLLVDLDGGVLLKSKNATETKVDLHGIIRNAMEARINGGDINESREFISFYPVDIEQEKAYVVVSGIAQPQITYRYRQNDFFPGLLGLITFFSLFYYLTKRKMEYIEQLAQGLLEISKGDLNYRVPEKSKDELGSLAYNINHMAQELQRKIEEERRAEKTKNELITNVSHDLRTPLTSVMGYLRLLKDKKYENHQEQEDYVNIAYGKAEKLKKLIEDLFEFTKISNFNIQLNTETVSLDEMLEQLCEELVPIAEENKLTFIKDMPLEKLMVNVDVEKMVRVFENLLMNAISYSHKPGRIKVSVAKKGAYAVAVVENKGDILSQEEVKRLFERFYRVEKSRTSSEGGSGLGLAISKNIVELHNGAIKAECDENIIRFIVQLKLVEKKDIPTEKTEPSN